MLFLNFAGFWNVNGIARENLCHFSQEVPKQAATAQDFLEGQVVPHLAEMGLERLKKRLLRAFTLCATHDKVTLQRLGSGVNDMYMRRAKHLYLAVRLRSMRYCCSKTHLRVALSDVQDIYKEVDHTTPISIK